MMPISFDIKFKPDNTPVLFMKWLGKPEVTTEISTQDLDKLIDRAEYLRTQIS